MVIYDLICPLNHKFEAWFKNAGAFEAQQKQGLVQCAMCGSSNIKRSPSGCHVGKKSTVLQSKQTNKNTPAKNSTPVDPVVLIKSLNKFVRDNCKDVGNDFTKMAINMHRGKIKEEAIYGNANKEQRDTLKNEGVSYLSVPSLPESYNN